MFDQNILNKLSSSDKRLAEVIRHISNIDESTYNNSNSFVFLVREIVGQMISSAVKKIIYNRLLDLCSGEISPSKINDLSIDQLRKIGLSNSKSSYIQNLAKITENNVVDFEYINSLDDESVIKELTKIKGIGNWTAKMYLIFFLRREDVLPYEDGAFLQAYKWLYNTNIVNPEAIKKRCSKWKPFTSIGARFLYKALDTGLTKIPIIEFINKSTYMDKSEDSIVTKISNYLSTQRPGSTFVYSDFDGFGSYSSIRSSLARLCDRNELTRLTQGVFMKPDKVAPDQSVIAMEIARKNGSKATILKDEYKGSTRVLSLLTNGSTRTLTLSEGTVLKYIHSNNI